MAKASEALLKYMDGKHGHVVVVPTMEPHETTKSVPLTQRAYNRRLHTTMIGQAQQLRRGESWRQHAENLWLQVVLFQISHGMFPGSFWYPPLLSGKGFENGTDI